MISSNPTLRPSTFESVAGTSGPVMTLTGTINKSAILLLLVILGASFTWNTTQGMWQILTFGGMIVGFILAMVTVFKMTWAPFTAPPYALFQGLFLGGISALYNQQFEGIVLQAVMLTFGIMAAMLLLYQTGVIKVNDTFRTVIVSAMGGIFLVYMASFIMSFFGVQMPFLHDASPLGIGISIVIVIVASLNLAISFDLVDRGVAGGAPRFMEWYCAFSLMVALIWLYLEILRLLSKLNRR